MIGVSSSKTLAMNAVGEGSATSLHDREWPPNPTGFRIRPKNCSTTPNNYYLVSLSRNTACYEKKKKVADVTEPTLGGLWGPNADVGPPGTTLQETTDLRPPTGSTRLFFFFFFFFFADSDVGLVCWLAIQIKT